jgi:DNA-binding MarR family transcriptional regulator
VIDFKTKATPDAYRNPTKNEKLVRQPKSKPPRNSSLEGKNSDLLKSSWRAQEGVHSLKSGVKMSSVDQGKEIKSEDLEGQEKKSAPTGTNRDADKQARRTQNLRFADDYKRRDLRFQVYSSDLPSGERLVLLAIIDHMNDDGELDTKLDSLAGLTGYKRRKVGDAVSFLEEAGYITTERLQYGIRYRIEMS